MNFSASTTATSTPVVDSILQAYEHAEAGRYADALTTIKNAKSVDPKNIYIIALERQFSKLLSLPHGPASKQQQTEIMESLPSLLERAITAAREHAQADAAASQSATVKSAERDAKLQTLKKQYFDHADEFLQKGEYDRALAEIRRIIILDPTNRVAKEYEQKIMQLATRQSQRVTGQSQRVSTPSQGKMPSAGVQPGSGTAPSSRVVSAGQQEEAVQVHEAGEWPSETVPDVKAKKSGKAGMLLAAGLGALIVFAAGAYLLLGGRPESREPLANISPQAVQQQAATPAAADQPAPQQAQPVPSSTPAPQESATPQIVAPPVQEKPAVRSAPPVTAQQPAATSSSRGRQQTAEKPKQTQPPAEKPKQEQQAPVLAANTTPVASPPASVPAPPVVKSAEEQSAAPEPFVPIEKEPQIIKLERPKLPSLALQSGLEGKVVVKVQIDPQGKPLQAVIVSSNNEVFNEAVIDAVMKSKFAPGMMTTGPVTSWLAIPFKFNRGK